MKTLRKILLLLVLALSLISFVGCEGGLDISDDEKLIQALDKIKINYSEGDAEGSVTKDLEFLFNGNDDIKVEWNSSVADIIDNNGKVTRPETDTLVKITVTVSINGTSLQKSFNITVKGLGEKQTEFTVAFNGNGGTLTSGKELQKVKNASEIVAPTYTKEGYTFDGWDKDITTLTQDATVNAKWKENKEEYTSYDDIAAVEVAEGETTTETYTVQGVIQSIDNTTFGNLTIGKDGKTLYIFGILDSEGKKYGELANKPVVGDTIVVTGVVKKYNGVNELVDALLVSVTKGDTPVVEPKTIDSTIAEVLALQIEDKATTTDYYKVTGKVSSIENTEYGNLYISDGQKTLYIYGLYDANGNRYDALTTKPEGGDEITVYGQVKNYSGTIEIVAAVLTNLVKGQPISVEALSIDEVLKLSSGEIAKTSGTVIAVNAREFIIQDNTGCILVYMNQKAFDYVPGDVVSVEGALSSYHDAVQFTDSAKIEKTGTSEYVKPNPTTLDGKGVDDVAANPKMGEYVKLSGKLVVEGTYYNVTVDGASKVISLVYPQDSFGLTILNGRKIEMEGYVVDISSDKTRLNIILTTVKCLEELTGEDLPLTSSFMVSVKETKELPSGWSWIKGSTSKGSYATLWQSFRNNGDGVQSPLFKATNGVKVTFTYYLNNSPTSGTSQVKVTAYDVSGKEVKSVISNNIGQGDTGTAKAKDLVFDIEGNDIAYVTLEFVKASGGNIGFSTIKIEALN